MLLVWLGVLLLAAGSLLLALARRRRTRTGIPAGDVIYSDTGLWEEPRSPLVSRRFGLVGRPDYLVRLQENGRSVTVPVEVKSRERPPTPYASHVLQLATYCLLVEDVLKERPPYGLLRYADVTIQIPFDDQLRSQVLETADRIRAARRALTVDRQHTEPARCRGCGYREPCGDQALG